MIDGYRVYSFKGEDAKKTKEFDIFYKDDKLYVVAEDVNKARRFLNRKFPVSGLKKSIFPQEDRLKFFTYFNDYFKTTSYLGCEHIKEDTSIIKEANLVI